MNKLFSSYTNFSKKEGIAIIVLILIIIPLAILPFLNKSSHTETTTADNNWASISGVLDEKQADGYTAGSNAGTYSRQNNNSGYTQSNAVSKARLFTFDPNTATAEQLQELGLRERTIQILINYRNKGGKFRKPEDLQKIYGLRPDEFERLRPYIVVQSSEKQNNFSDSKYENNDHAATPKTEYKRKVAAIDVNTADTTAFQSLYGIGSKLAARIVNFRTKLGGFYSIEQVSETYGVPEETFQNIKQYLIVNASAVKKLNANTATYDELNAHPYISSKLAYLIMKHRKDNGNLTSPDSLKDLVAQTNDSYEKVMHYITF